MEKSLKGKVRLDERASTSGARPGRHQRLYRYVIYQAGAIVARPSNMVADNEQNGDRPQAVDVRPVGEISVAPTGRAFHHPARIPGKRHESRALDCATTPAIGLTSLEAVPLEMSQPTAKRLTE